MGKRNGSEAMALRSKIQDWIISKLIQFFTLIQIICLIIMGLINIVKLVNHYDVVTNNRLRLPEASYYLCLYLIWFMKKSDLVETGEGSKGIEPGIITYALASIIFVNVCLIYCTWMEKPSFEYWKWRQEKTGRVLLEWLNITGFFTNFTLLGSLAIGIGTLIGIFKCHLGESACNEWNTEGLDNLTNVILIHDIIAGIWVFKCVLWKILIPLYKYLDITCPVYEGSKLWKLDGDKLQNKAFPHTLLRQGMTMWDCFDKWNFKTKDDLIYIENSSERKVLEALRHGDVILKNFEEDKAEQLWKKGEPNAEGYFTL